MCTQPRTLRKSTLRDTASLGLPDNSQVEVWDTRFRVVSFQIPGSRVYSNPKNIEVRGLTPRGGGCLQSGTQELLHRNVKRFRGGLVFKADRLWVSLNSRLESNKEEEENPESRNP